MSQFMRRCVLPVIFIGLIGCGFNSRERAEIRAGKQRLADAQRQFQQIRDEVSRDLQAEPVLFSAGARDATWRQRLESGEADLKSAAQNIQRMEDMGRRGHKGRSGWVEQTIQETDQTAQRVVQEATGIRAEANRGLDLKRNLSTALQDMEHQHDAVHAFDFAPVQEAVRRAATDWPDKKSDLDGRLQALQAIPADSDTAWQSVSEARTKPDYAALYAAEETLRQDSTNLPKQAQDLKNLSGQLYVSWDKILEDLDDNHQGNRRTYEEKIKTVNTRLTDVAAKTSEVSSSEKWDEISEDRYRSLENNLGMTVERKASGKYDSESDQVAQPPGYAYIASPEQGRNQYGYWDNRGGEMFWTFFPQYLLMRELFWGRYYQPIPVFEWNSYHSNWARGRVYYGHDPVTNAPKFGSRGTFTANRYATSRYLTTGGGFSRSKYAPGNRAFDSRPSRSFSRGSDSAPHRFGNGSGSGRKFGSSPSRSSGRSFGRRR